MSKALYSFDIFDTLINRRTATPEGIYVLMQQKLQTVQEYSDFPKRLTENFFLIRIQAEKVARNTYVKDGVHDITIEHIYESISLMEELSKEQIERLVELEVNTELENAIPVIQNIQRVKELKEKGERVVLVSNMYLREKDIRKILLHVDSVLGDIPMYISGDLGKTKGTKTLYHYVKQQEKIAFADWYHLGDNIELDVNIPRGLGMQAELFEQPELTGWEKEMLEANVNNVDVQLLLGVSKRIGKRDEIAYQVGVGYSAEVLVPYVLWVLEQAVKKGIEKLFFIARDGYILKLIADIIIKKYEYPMETSYLYGSRKAWRLPALNKDNFDMKEFLTWNYPGQIFSYERIAEIFGLTMEELIEFLPFAKISQTEISRAVVKESIEILVEHQDYLIDFIVQKQRNKRERVVQYLYQELGKEKNYAFVDLIGSGYTQKCLADLMKEFCDVPVKTFFYRLDSCRKYERNINYAYFPNRIKMGNIIEILCGAMHGQTCDYECKKGRWVPVFGEDEGEALQAYGFELYLQGITDYVEEMVNLYPQSQLKILGLEVPEIYFNYMAARKHEVLYDYIADMPYTITGQEKKVSSFAPKLTNKDLRKIYIWNKGRNLKKIYSGYSLEFSLTRLTESQQKRVEFYKKHSEDKVVRWIRDNVLHKEKKVINSKYELIADEIILYGAGKKGQLLYQQLTHGKEYHAKIALWVDKNYEKCDGLPMKISAPDDILRGEYKQIIIAVANQSVATQIKCELIEKGIPSMRILWINPDNRIQ